MEAAAQPLSDRLVELAGIETGMRVLDVATGIGEPALTAARRVGASGRVLATDLAPGMIELGTERARDDGLTNVTFELRDAEALGLEPQSFDAALSRWGLMLMPNPADALAGIKTTLCPGGRLACSVWSSPERVPFLVLGRDTVAEALGIEPPPAEMPGPFRLAEAGALRALVEGAGFTIESEERFNVRFTFENAEGYADFVFDLSSVLSQALAEASAATRDAAREALLAEVRPETGADGRLVLDNETVCLAARR